MLSFLLPKITVFNYDRLIVLFALCYEHYKKHTDNYQLSHLVPKIIIYIKNNEINVVHNLWPGLYPTLK